MKLFIFAVQSYGAMASFDGGDTDESFDNEPVIVGHQFAESYGQAKGAMVKDLADELGIDEVEEPTEDADEATWDGFYAYEKKLEELRDELQHFELVVGGEHSTLFLS